MNRESAMMLRYGVVAVSCLTLFHVSRCALAEEVNFNRDIRPILSDRCFACHGLDKLARKADLRLDLRDAAVESKAIVPGQPDQSLLIERIFSHDDQVIMPPAKSNKPLTLEEKNVLRKWVAE